MADLYLHNQRDQDTNLGFNLTSGALPLVGVSYTNQAFTYFPAGIRRVTFHVSYQRNAGAASGQPRFRLEWVNTNGDTVKGSILDASAVVVASPYGRVVSYQIEIDGPIVTAAAATFFPYTFEVPSGMAGVRLLATEVTAAAGTCEIRISGSTKF